MSAHLGREADRTAPQNLDVVGVGVNRIGTVCSIAVALKEKAECPVPSKPFPLPPLATEGPRRVAHVAKAGRQEPVVGLLFRSWALRRGGRGLTAKPARRSPGNGAATA